MKKRNILIEYSKKVRLGGWAGEMVQCLKMLIVLPKEHKTYVGWLPGYPAPNSAL